MAISQAMATSFKQQLLLGQHNFGFETPHTFLLALYGSSATLSAGTTSYTTAQEVGATGTYVAGGGTLTNVTPATSGTTAYTDFADLSFSSATITARGAVIYNTTPTNVTNYPNAAVAILDFSSDQSSTAGTFTIQFPTADGTSAILRLA